MGSYRDDRSALRQQIGELERDLARARGEGKREQIEDELAALTARLDEAREKVEGDRAALEEIGEALTRLRAAAGVEPVRATPAAGGQHLWLIALGTGGLLAALAFAATRSTTPSKEARSYAGIPGAPHAVDPIVLLDHAERAAGKQDHLVSIEADYVRHDGTVNLAAETYRGQIAYTFGTAPPDPPVDPSRPLGAPPPPRDLPSEQTVVVSASGVERRSSMIGVRSTPVRRPRCSTRQVWQAAIAAGAPESAVARLRYAAPPLSHLRLAPPAVWTFKIEGTSTEHEIDDDTCRAR